MRFLKDLKTTYKTPACRVRSLWAEKSFLWGSKFNSDDPESYDDRGDDSDNWI